jgi:A/G-specific adenine glycosylase
VVRKKGKLLITQRKSEGLLGGLWEFPGGKMRPGEDAQRACIREIREETGIVVEIDRPLTRVKHAYTHFKIEMEVFCCRFVSGRVRLNGPQAFRWIRSNQIREFPFPKANLKFISLLENEGETGRCPTGI